MRHCSSPPSSFSIPLFSHQHSMVDFNDPNVINADLGECAFTTAKYVI